MTLIWTIVIGFVIGLVARGVMPGRDPMGFAFTSLLGTVGAMIAQLLGQLVGFYHDGEPAGFLASVVGSLTLLFIARRVQRVA